MCRQAAFPPGTTREEALEVLLHFQGKNIEGVGSVYVKAGRFIVDKAPISLTMRLRGPQGPTFLGHMPYDGWTIAHLRNSTRGVIAPTNTHPFTAGAWCVAHNGTWYDDTFVAKLLKATINLRLKGDTDSEVAAHTIALIGPRSFVAEMDWAGTFLCLHADGSLQVAKVNGDLWAVRKGAVPGQEVELLSSEVDGRVYRNREEMQNGWYHYDRHGHFVQYESGGHLPQNNAQAQNAPSRAGLGKANRYDDILDAHFAEVRDDEDFEVFGSAFAAPFITGKTATKPWGNPRLAKSYGRGRPKDKVTPTPFRHITSLRPVARPGRFHKVYK